ncbi:MAG: thioredoxin-like domain-containing protein [Opitutales bacterium]
MFIGTMPVLLHAEDGYLEWNDIIGRSFKAKIVDAGALKVTLENSDGKQIDFPIADLKPSSKEHVNAWINANQKTGDASGAADAGEGNYKSSVFDDVLLGNLVRLDGKSLKPSTDATRPEKYYVFYYTASWCGPCRRFTPSLVEWYKKNKSDAFELVLITSDNSEDAMEGYAKSADMPWPLLDFKDAKKFKSSFKHGVRGIPSLIVCKLDGENLGNYRSRLSELSKMVK